MTNIAACLSIEAVLNQVGYRIYFLFFTKRGLKIKGYAHPKRKEN